MSARHPYLMREPEGGMDISKAAKLGVAMKGMKGMNNLFQDMGKYVGKRPGRKGIAQDYWLHRAGLARYNPVRRTFFSLGLLVLGGIGGALAALALAPKAGPELRGEMKDRARKMMERAKEESHAGY